jgi:5-methylcytosine-specific restriction endonuclease McrA
VSAIPVRKFPMSMTGAKLRKSMGLEANIYADHDWRLPSKFSRIPKAARLEYLITESLKETGVSLSADECRQMRQGFEHRKHSLFPMSRTCPCYSCEGTARVRHHVVPISGGGRNKRNNVVPICDGCHALIHPNMSRG